MNSNGLPWDQERELLRFKQELKGSFVSACLVTGLSQRLLQGSEEEEMLLDGESVLRYLQPTGKDMWIQATPSIKIPFQFKTRIGLLTDL